MDTLEFYGGVNEIGGNKIKLNLDATSLLLDFGMSFSEAGKYFADFSNPRKGNGLEDYFELGLLPRIKGIYREDYLRHKGHPFDEKPAVDGLLLSHAHADHADYIGFLREDIPLYMSEISKLIFEVLDDIGNQSKEILVYKPQFKYYRNGEKYSKVTTRQEAPHKRDIRILKPYEVENIGNLEVQLAPVDHSLPGAAAYFIKGKENGKKIIYTGDLRFHGRNKKDSFDFLEKAIEFSPEIMVCEGTRIDSAENLKDDKFKYEEEIEDSAYELINEYNGLVIVNFPLRDLDRLITFHNLAKRTDRTLLITLKQAYMLNHLEKHLKNNIYPTIKDKHIGVHIPRRGNGAYPFDSYGLFKEDLKDKNEESNWRHSDKITAKLDYLYKWQKDFI